MTDAALADSAGSSRDMSLVYLLRRWKTLAAVAVAAGLLGYGGSHFIAPTYLASTLFMPPQQAGLPGGAATAALGALAGISGAGKNTTDQYATLLQSTTIADRLIERFDLMAAYKEKYKETARKRLAKQTRVIASKKDGMISLTFEDELPQRAADIANAYVDELTKLNARIAVTEAQQRRVFFEKQMLDTRQKLAAAQTTLQGTGLNEDSIKAEPKAAADGYAKLRAEVSAAEVKLKGLRASMTDSAQEVRLQTTILQALRGNLAQMEKNQTSPIAQGYIQRYREYKYQETLFDIMARQYESARLDEAREGALVQVVDAATPPERKIRPQRMLTGLFASAAALVVCLIWLLIARFLAEVKARPAAHGKWVAFRAALKQP